MRESSVAAIILQYSPYSIIKRFLFTVESEHFIVTVVKVMWGGFSCLKKTVWGQATILKLKQQFGFIKQGDKNAAPQFL